MGADLCRRDYENTQNRSQIPQLSWISRFYSHFVASCNNTVSEPYQAGAAVIS